jgi:hypothetical protein
LFSPWQKDGPEEQMANDSENAACTAFLLRMRHFSMQSIKING